MMEFYSLQEITNIDDEIVSIKVKVSRKWEEFNPVDKQIEGLNVIFVDPYVCSIEYIYIHIYTYRYLPFFNCELTYTNKFQLANSFIFLTHAT